MNTSFRSPAFIVAFPINIQYLYLHFFKEAFKLVLAVQICYKICYRFETENVFEVMLDDNILGMIQQELRNRSCARAPPCAEKLLDRL